MIDIQQLKKLTPEQCAFIANIVVPEINWKVIEPEDKWEGFDLCSEDEDSNQILDHIFQIDYRADENIKDEYRFRYYYELSECSTTTSEELQIIKDYLKSV